MRKVKKGYTLVLVLVVSFFISLTAMTSLIIISRYSKSLNNRREQLGEIVYVTEGSEEL